MQKVYILYAHENDEKNGRPLRQRNHKAQVIFNTFLVFCFVIGRVSDIVVYVILLS